jgi:hypothetical protein
MVGHIEATVTILTSDKLASLFLIAAVLSGDENSNKYSTRMGDFDQDTIVRIQGIVSQQVCSRARFNCIMLTGVGRKPDEERVSLHSS